MENSNINLIIKHLAQEELSSAEIELVMALKQLNPKEFSKIEAAYHSDIFSALSFDSKLAYEKLDNRIVQEKESSKTIPFYSKAWIQVAASIVLFLGLSIVFSTQYEWQQTHKNQTGKLEKVVLPDGSIITLDKNASYSYSRTLLKEFGRDISLKGRAYFKITKNPEHEFIVHNPMADITVLGTEFTINQKEHNTQIILHEGIIELSGNQLKNSIIIDQIGTQIIIDKLGVNKEMIISNNLYASWKEAKINFQHCQLQEVLDFMEDTYDIQTKINDKDVLSKTLLGSAPSDDPYLILNAIAEILDTKIEIISKN